MRVADAVAIALLSIAASASPLRHARMAPTLTVASSHRSGGQYPIPTAEQLAWQQSEMACFVHYNMATAAGSQGCSCSDTPPDISIWNPNDLNTDEWIKAGKAMGCKRFVYVAKHGCGFVAWNSSVAGYDYTVAHAKNTTDVVQQFVASARKFGVGYGFYYSVTNNAFAGVCDSKVSPTSRFTQDQYDSIVLGHLRELWSQYGALAEVWFDGGYNHNLTNQLSQLFATLQPTVIAFQGERLMPSPVRWVGTEAGIAPYPCWSTCDYDSYGQGSEDARTWFPAETDFTLQVDDNWFYNPSVGVHPPAELRFMYESSIGHNTAAIIDFAPMASGKIPEEQIEAAVALGLYVKRCYSSAVLSTNGSATLQYVLSPESATIIDRIVIQEDQSFGQLIRAFSIDVTFSNGSKLTVFSGSSVGNKFIFPLSEPSAVLQVVLNIQEIIGDASGPHIRNFAIYRCSHIADEIDAHWANRSSSTTSPFSLDVAEMFGLIDN